MPINSTTTTAFHSLSSTAATSAPPPSFSCESARMAGVTPTRSDESGFRSLDEKINSFHKGDGNLLVSVMQCDFDRDFFNGAIEKRFNNANTQNHDVNSQCNFSTSLLYSNCETELYAKFRSPLMMLALSSFDEVMSELPIEMANALESSRDQIEAIEQELIAADRECSRGNNTSQGKSKDYLMAVAKLNDLFIRKKEIYQAALGSLTEFNYSLKSRLVTGFIANDRGRLMNALTVAGATHNREFVKIMGPLGKSGPKCYAHAIDSKPERAWQQDKSAKINAKGETVSRPWPETLAALRKHLEKHGNTELTEVLVTPADKESKHFVDAFFISLHSPMEPLNLDEVNLFLFHNQASVQTFRHQTKDLPLLVLYMDKNEQKNKFAYVTFNAEGVPVASLMVPADQE